MGDTTDLYEQASIKTADNLMSIAQSESLRELSTMSLPEIEAVVGLVSQVIPAGNVPGVILNGLSRLPGRKPPFKTFKRDINLLFQGIEQSLDKAVYAAVFAGPAAVIWGYQNLLKLAGKDPIDSFPEGLWQFYVDYAMREDTARHTNETHGFDTLLQHHNIELSQVDRLTAWTMTAIYCLHDYNHLLQNEWRERVYTKLLQKITQTQPNAANYVNIYRQWEKERPYIRSQEAALLDFTTYRQQQFDQFFEQAVQTLPPKLQRELSQQADVAKQDKLPAYQHQMSILSYLEPNEYGENRVSINILEAKVGLVYNDHYYLIPACQPGTDQPAEVQTVRSQITTILESTTEKNPVRLAPLAEIRRAAWPTIREVLPETLVGELDRLRYAPIIINAGSFSSELPLAALRQAERGIGDHALTIISADKSVVFDQSHIYFDGAWGAALAEILTGEAVSWALYLKDLSPAKATETVPPKLNLPPFDIRQQAPTIIAEAFAETELVNLKAILKLRKRFKQRSDLLNLTVNDLLILYRAIHAATYQPKAELMQELEQLILTATTQPAAQSAIDAIKNSKRVNPAMVIPVDASPSDPQSRLYPMTFTVPLVDLDLLSLHAQTLSALKVCTTTQTSEDYEKFQELQRNYLASVAGFGAVSTKAKEIAIAGESASVGTMKMLAHIPKPLQKMLDMIPSQFELLNDLIKGREVFSNVGAVVPTSTLTRFITAKDDNDKKTLAWGVLTDANGVMRVTLRDFRPHVALLKNVGYHKLANQIAQDYLEAYAHGLNNYVADLQQITETSQAMTEN